MSLPSRALCTRVLMLTLIAVAMMSLNLVLVTSTATMAQALQTRDVVYKTTDGLELRLDVRMPNGSGPYPAIMLIHGGKQVTGDKCQAAIVDTAKRFVSAGFVVYAPNYRLAPDHPGISPIVKCYGGATVDVTPYQGNVYPAGRSDVEDALAWITLYGADYKTDVSRVSALGTSAGGTHAYMLGALGLVDVAVGWSGPTYYDGSSWDPALHTNYVGCDY